MKALFFCLLIVIGTLTMAFAGDAGVPPAPVPEPLDDPSGFLSRAYEIVKGGWGVPVAALLVILAVGAIKRFALPKLEGNAARLAVFGMAMAGAVAHSLAIGEPFSWPLVQIGITVGTAAIAAHTAAKTVLPS